MTRSTPILAAACLATILSVPAQAAIRFDVKPSAQHRMLMPSQIDNRVYAACQQKVIKTLGNPPGTAANFKELWAAYAYRCALSGGYGW